MEAWSPQPCPECSELRTAVFTPSCPSGDKECRAQQWEPLTAHMTCALPEWAGLWLQHTPQWQWTPDRHWIPWGKAEPSPFCPAQLITHGWGCWISTLAFEHEVCSPWEWKELSLRLRTQGTLSVLQTMKINLKFNLFSWKSQALCNCWSCSPITTALHSFDPNVSVKLL